MDPRTTLTPPQTGPTTLTVEHAVFTSIPSPMGSGYRLVAHSRGLTAPERQQITRCAPSHGSLCDNTTGAAGLASFPLDSGRHCLLLPCNAEEEHTGRGGCRVHTHVLVLSTEDFARCGHDPWRLAITTHQTLGDNLLTKSEGNLEPLALPLGTPLEGWPTRHEAEQATRLLDALLTQRPTLLNDLPLAEDLIRLALTGLPAQLRSTLSLSSGIKFTPKRAFQFLLLNNATSNEIERIAQSHEYTTFDADAGDAPVTSAYQTWCDFATTRWQAGRVRQLDTLAARLDTIAPDVLTAVAELTTYLENVPESAEERLNELATDNMRISAHHHVVADLQQQLGDAIRQRREQLAAEAAAQAAEEQAQTEDQQ